jgi:hypothetical protein
VAPREVQRSSNQASPTGRSQRRSGDHVRISADCRRCRDLFRSSSTLSYSGTLPEQPHCTICAPFLASFDTRQNGCCIIPSVFQKIVVASSLGAISLSKIPAWRCRCIPCPYRCVSHTDSHMRIGLTTTSCSRNCSMQSREHCPRFLDWSSSRFITSLWETTTSILAYFAGIPSTYKYLKRT